MEPISDWRRLTVRKTLWGPPEMFSALKRSGVKTLGDLSDRLAKGETFGLKPYPCPNTPGNVVDLVEDLKDAIESAQRVVT